MDTHPPSFSWVEKDVVAACGLPTKPVQEGNEVANHQCFVTLCGMASYRVFLAHNQLPLPEHFKFFYDVGIRHVISLRKLKGAQENCDRFNLRLSLIDIEDFHPPTPDQIDQFLRFVEEGKREKLPVVVHCTIGRGRTGTLLACYLIKQKNLTAHQALAEIRRIRPGSVETIGQEQAIEDYCDRLCVA